MALTKMVAYYPARVKKGHHAWI